MLEHREKFSQKILSCKFGKYLTERFSALSLREYGDLLDSEEIDIDILPLEFSTLELAAIVETANLPTHQRCCSKSIYLVSN